VVVCQRDCRDCADPDGGSEHAQVGEQELHRHRLHAFGAAQPRGGGLYDQRRTDLRQVDALGQRHQRPAGGGQRRSHRFRQRRLSFLCRRLHVPGQWRRHGHCHRRGRRCDRQQWCGQSRHHPEIHRSRHHRQGHRPGRRRTHRHGCAQQPRLPRCHLRLSFRQEPRPRQHLRPRCRIQHRCGGRTQDSAGRHPGPGPLGPDRQHRHLPLLHAGLLHQRRGHRHADRQRHRLQRRQQEQRHRYPDGHQPGYCQRQLYRPALPAGHRHGARCRVDHRRAGGIHAHRRRRRQRGPVRNLRAAAPDLQQHLPLLPDRRLRRRRRDGERGGQQFLLGGGRHAKRAGRQWRGQSRHHGRARHGRALHRGGADRRAGRSGGRRHGRCRPAE